MTEFFNKQDIGAALQNYGPAVNVPTPQVPAQQQPGFFANIMKNPELLAMALDQLGGIINPSQGKSGLGTMLAQSSVANKAYQQRRGELTPQDQDGETSVVRKAGPDGRTIEVTTRTLPRDDPFGTPSGEALRNP